ncbi:hypothetical protein [Lacipirellula sp.]|uniref:hypothetical protein n=1 Tax=Lacipirellula sp. TaxID=2691419 RepID=UPI003D14532D
MANDTATKPASTRPTTRAGRRARQAVTFADRFEPKFLETTDQRCKVVRLIRERIKQLTEDAGIDCIQKELLAKQAVFISVQLETMQVDALEGCEFEVGRFCNLTNTLVGLLKTLGISRTTPKAVNLKAYLGSKT